VADAFHGITRRYVLKSAKLAQELFVVDFDGYPLDPRATRAWDSQSPTDEYEFDGHLALDLALIYRRRWGTESKLDHLLVAFAGNVAAGKKPVPLGTVDASDYEPLPDDEFWPIIDLLEGKMWETRISRAASALATQPDEFILRFAQSAARKMWELDSPDICEPATAGDGTHYLDGGWSNHRRGAAIAGGRQSFDSACRSPASMRELTVSDLSWGVGLIAAQAWQRRHGLSRLTTSWSAHPGSNEERWATETRRVIGLGERWEESTPEETESYYLALRRIQQENGLPSERPLYVEDGTWWASRVLIAHEGVVDECVVLSAVPDASDGWESTADACAVVARTLNGTIVSAIERQDRHTRLLQSGTMFGIKRRSGLEISAYLAKFVPDG
jgi:hypothetical protein